ncbi:MAG TPA: hypothetical protein PK992_00970 [Planctomycetaceae bacterium]|nr:hypothetical protein [Planctomycetaceae bacterium]HRA86600.1 hypothetical protein [Planctomycetaceae bacterium]
MRSLLIASERESTCHSATGGSRAHDVEIPDNLEIPHNHRTEVLQKHCGMVLPKKSKHIVNDCRFAGDSTVLLVVLV